MTAHLFPPIPDVSTALDSSLRAAIDHKTKPLGSLGQLEHLALRIGRIQQSTTPRLSKPHICVFAADHGITNEGVSAYPADVTAQMVLNFLNGGAGINVFARQNGIALTVVDAGVNAEFGAQANSNQTSDNFIQAKIQRGTKSFLREAAMTEADMEAALQQGAEIVRRLHADGCNVIGFGEMGIGNTSAAAAIMHSITQIPLQYCIGRGAGLTNEQLTNKHNVLQQAIERHSSKTLSPLDTLRTFGGFEIAMMCGAMAEAARLSMIVLVDGFIASSALLVVHALSPAVLDYCIFSHESDEHGHRAMLDYLGVTPLLRLNLRLGEGTGCALAYPLVSAAVNFLNEMATFDSAGVSGKV